MAGRRAGMAGGQPRLSTGPVRQMEGGQGRGTCPSLPQHRSACSKKLWNREQRTSVTAMAGAGYQQERIQTRTPPARPAHRLLEDFKHDVRAMAVAEHNHRLGLGRGPEVGLRAQGETRVGAHTSTAAHGWPACRLRLLPPGLFLVRHCTHALRPPKGKRGATGSPPAGAGRPG